MSEIIRRNLALREYDIKEDPAGNPVTFAIKFVKKNGELVFIPRGRPSGLPFNATANRMRGVMPVDENLEQTGHVYAVDIDAIVEWNGKKVVI